MKLVEFAVKRPVTMTILVAVILILGFFTYAKLPVDLYPDMQIPVAMISTSYPGAGPEEVEERVSKPIEGTVATLSNVKKVQSTSSAGNSTVVVFFEWGTNMDSAMQDIRERLGLVETWLPKEAEKPFVLKIDPSLMPIIQLAVSAEENPERLRDIAEDIIIPRLERISQVAAVYSTGGKAREIKVEVDPVKLESYGLSMAQVAQVLQMENFNMSSGKADSGERQYFVRTLQEFVQVSDIGETAIITPQGNTVYLKDIARISEGYKEQDQLTRVNGNSALGIHVMKQTGANTVAASQAVHREIEKLSGELGKDIKIDFIFDQADFIKSSISNTVNMILKGALLAMLVLFLFLHNMRSTLIIFAAIPLSIIATFIIMYFSGYSVNLLTMGGLALGVGRIVDDSIVVFENIYRHRSLGLLPREAAVKGATEVGGAVIATTTTLLAVFLPIVFVEGLASLLFKPLALTISFAMICSLLVALTVIPLLSSRVLTDASMQRAAEPKGRIGRVVKKFADFMDNLGEKYRIFLARALKRRKLVALVVTVLMIGALAAVPLVGAEFMPAMDSGEISVRIKTDKGSSLAATDEITNAVEEKIREVPEVEVIFTSVGQSSFMMSGGGHTDSSLLYVKLTDRKNRERGVDLVAEEIRRELSLIPGAKIEVSVMDQSSNMGSGSGGPINIQVRGDDLNTLREISSEVVEIVKKVPGTREVTCSLTDGSPEIRIRVDRKRAAAFNLTPMQIAGEIKNAMEGTVVTRYKAEGQEVDVRIKYLAAGEKDIEYLKNITIMSPVGGVKLSSLAVFEMGQGPVSITRVDQVRQADINGYLLNRDLKSVIDDIKKETDKLTLPAGYSIEFGGQAEDMMESFSSLAVALLLAIILVYAVMAVQYESFFDPFVIMFSVPTAFIGVVLGLLLTGRSFSVPAFIGAIMMVGIVVSNAIVFVDYLKKLRERGMEREEAILEAGRVRLRPILMTAFSTILAMIPLALGLGEGGEAQAPLATVIISGLLVSTLITLVLVPVVYSVFDDLRGRFRIRDVKIDK
ncbi:hydrophobic/amphiphilic exporter-1, HAE1 family [Thermosyntropha lipolytica DSM 11003]|uniref:Hydrophobic/amphiphilic exporter-1, HAE1 family n=1 Tax=Thermosyntropha lipolytica DSM 11003 TaxID=1123382 RepID=A0A1M5Q653_9FIRM|nr:efflux RND transporter permease subunit [Thermosyntropha lipolytica]SHH09251.1 hydrophobic/amphiphilic exporter-1, HAE1 family [Thermosyntropha lipolytica DSM 11003]